MCIRDRNASIVAPPKSAPIVNWPSAPIFHTPARNPIDSPSAIIISGVAFTISSDNPKIDKRGSTKIIKIAKTGFFPINKNKINTNIIKDIIKVNSVPIISPLGLGKNNQTFNINGDTAAGAIAKSLKCRRLLLSLIHI